MKKTIILLFISILTLGCSKKNDDEIIQETSDVIISTEQTNLKDTQLSTITVENYILAKETYSAKFGDQDIVLGKVNDSSLTFMVPPNIPSGKYNLVIDIASNTIEFDITKTELTETPENVFSNFVGDYQNEIDQTIALFDQGNVPPQLLSAKDKIDKAITDLNNLSETDKIIAAKFIERNTTDLKELERALSQESIIYSGKTILKRCNTFDCYLTYAAKVAGVIIAVKVGTLGATVFGALLGADAIISAIRGKRSVLFSKAKKVFSESLNISIFYSSKVIQLVYEEGNNRFTSYRTANVNPYKIDNNTTIKFNIKPTKRTLNQEDENSSNEIVKNFIAVYLKIKNLWNEHFIDELGTLPTFNDNETQEFADELSQFSLVISNNSENVSVSSISGSVEEFTATFTNSTDIEQDFTLDVIFKEGDAEQKVSVDFTIGFDEMHLEKVSMDNQIGTENNTLDKPTIVKVVNSEGTPVNNVEVDFRTEDGQGSVNQSRVKTDSNGVAQVYWTLGDLIGEQKLIADIVKSDGTLAGKEVIFNSICNVDLNGTWVAEYTSGDCSEGEINVGTTRSFKFNLDNSQSITVSGNFNDYITSSNFNQYDLTLYVIINSSQDYQYQCEGKDVTSKEIGRIAYSGTYNTTTKIFEGTYTHSFIESGNNCTENTICDGNVKISRQ